MLPPVAVRFLLVGDSTVTDDSGWGRGFEQHLSGGTAYVNLARNGRSSRSYLAEGHWAAVLAEARKPANGRQQPPDGGMAWRPEQAERPAPEGSSAQKRGGGPVTAGDTASQGWPLTYVLIQFGHNDQPGKGPERETDPATTYKEFLGRYVDEARAAGMHPVLVTSLVRRHFGLDGRIVPDLLVGYAAAARELAAAKGVPVIDLHARSTETLNQVGPKVAEEYSPANADGTPDRTHLTPRGSAVFGGIVAEELKKAVPAIARFLW